MAITYVANDRRNGRTMVPAARELFPSLRSFVNMTIVVLLAASASEMIFPEAGLFTRLEVGNAVADENFVARNIREQARKLTFAVAGIIYTVDTPSRELSPYERTAWLNYARRHGFSAYSVDGPLAIDP